MADNKPDDPADDVFDDSFDFDADTDDLLTEDETLKSVETPQTPGTPSATAAPIEEHPSDFELPQQPQQQPQPQSQPDHRSKYSVLIKLIALAAVALALWKGIEIFFTPHAHKPVHPVANVIPKIEKPKPIPVVVAPPPPVEPAIMTQLTALQKNVNEQNASTKQQVQKLETDLAAANQNVVAASKNIMALQQQIATLSGVVQNLTHQLQTAREEHKKKAAPVHHHKKPVIKKEEIIVSKEVFANPSLTVYAIIPGRAWLRDPTGKTITITEGDKLLEYGKVVKIDATTGIVVTSSGVTLR